MMDATNKERLSSRLNLYISNHCSVIFIDLFFQRCCRERFECCLIGQIKLDQYQAIVTKACFNLKPAVRSPFTNKDFQSDRPIQLELALKPELLPRLLEHASTAEEALEYLVKLSEEVEERRGRGAGDRV